MNEDLHEVERWKRTIRSKALNRDVLVVATTRIEGTWKAYCGAVPGFNHDAEWREILRHGGTVEERIARAMFPEFADMKYAR